MKYLNDKENLKLLVQLLLAFVIGALLSYLHPLLGIGVSFLMVVLFIVQFLNQREQRVNNLKLFLQKLNEGDYTYDIEAYQEGELAKLQAELNRTTVHLKSMNLKLTQQHDFLKQALEDISHQLKTPLASLLILNELQNQEDDLVFQSHHQILRLKTLIDRLLRLIKLEAQTETFKLETIPVTDLIEDVLMSMQPLIDEAKLDIILKLEDSACLCDVSKSQEALLNVLSNKLRYAKTKIEITTISQGLSTLIHISDDGDAIAKVYRERIFERFFTLAGASSNTLGIGLAIAKAIMLNQDGDLYLVDGNTFTFQFQRFQ